MNNIQEHIINEIDRMNSLPHSILLVGDYGAGHINVCNYIANKFNLDIYNMTDFISLEYINEINQSMTRTLYYVNMSDIDVRCQNILLKIFEEPNEYTYIVLNCETEESVLDTIKSRSYILKFNKFTREQLESYIYSNDTKELVLSICSTPGQIEIANNTDMNALYTLCNKIINSISVANFQNTLSISDKINFSDEYSKFDLRLFLKMLKYVILMNDVNNKLQLYGKVNSISKYIYSMNDKKRVFENLLINMWSLYRN